MRLMYALLLVCLLALVWAAWSVARAVRRHRRGQLRPPTQQAAGIETLGITARPDPAPDDDTEVTV